MGWLVVGWAQGGAALGVGSVGWRVGTVGQGRDRAQNDAGHVALQAHQSALVMAKNYRGQAAKSALYDNIVYMFSVFVSILFGRWFSENMFSVMFQHFQNFSACI